ncbi:MAG: PilZ domain-containing protein, partial [Rhizobiaceae bacterium]
MKVVRERPCQRRHHRVTAPMKVRVPNGATVMATNWSLGGLRLDGLDTNKAPLPADQDVIDLSLTLPFQGFDINFDVSAKVVRSNNEEGMIACEFEELSERAHDLMNHFIDDLVRGSMATVEDTICRIDVPVTPISTKPDPNPTNEAPVRRIPVKTIVMSAIYCVVGLLAFGYLGILLYSGTMRMEVRSAVVSAPLATLKMPVDGIVRPIRFEMGALVRQGQEIARIENANFLGDLEDA